MISLNVLLDIVATDALESGGMPESLTIKKPLPPIKYNLELIQCENGELYWVE